MDSLYHSAIVQRPPLWLRTVNKALITLSGTRSVERIGGIQELLSIASRKATLSDFGNSNFQMGLDAFLQSLNDDVNLSPVGQIVLRKTLIDYLVNRLRIQDALCEEPSIANLPVNKPLFILGLSRTGTTLLHNLLALTPDARAPRTWELLQPAPPYHPGDRSIRNRILKARWQLQMLNFAAPYLKLVHPINALDIEECYPLLNHTFTSPAFVMHYGVPGYLNWLTNIPFDALIWAYREYRSQLQILQYGHPEHRWILKCAAHLFNLHALLHVFPDALVVQTHRDLRQTIPSICSMITCFRNLICVDCPPVELGQECLDRIRTTLVRGKLARMERSPNQFLDIEFAELIRDPIKQVRRIHEYFGLDWDSTTEESMKNWIIANPPNRYGIHRYSLAQFGLNEEKINAYLSEDSLSNEL